MESGGKISIGSFSRRAPRALKTEFGIRNLETQDLLVSPLFGGVPISKETFRGKFLNNGIDQRIPQYIPLTELGFAFLRHTTSSSSSPLLEQPQQQTKTNITTTFTTFTHSKRIRRVMWCCGWWVARGFFSINSTMRSTLQTVCCAALHMVWYHHLPICTMWM